MNGFLIPTNTKKSMLIFGLFNTLDLIIIGIGVGITLFLILLVPLESLTATIIALLPGSIAVFLIIPVPNYHNIRTYLMSMYFFFTNRRRFIWKGWCVLSGKKEDSE